MGSQRWEWFREYWSYYVHRTWDIDDSRSPVRWLKWSLRRDYCSCHFDAVDIDSQGIAVDGESFPPARWSVLPQHSDGTRKSYLGQVLPVSLYFGRRLSPVVADDLGDLWIGQTRMLSHDMCLMMLTVQDECCAVMVNAILTSLDEEPQRQATYHSWA